MNIAGIDIEGEIYGIDSECKIYIRIKTGYYIVRLRKYSSQEQYVRFFVRDDYIVDGVPYIFEDVKYSGSYIEPEYKFTQSLPYEHESIYMLLPELIEIMGVI